MLSPALHSLMVDARITEMRRAGVRKVRLPRRTRRRSGALGIERAVTIRFAFPDDGQALERVADLDSCAVLASPALLCEVDGELWAAVSLADSATAADPFRPTAGVVELLTARAGQLREQGATGGGRRRVLQPAMPAR